MKNASSLFLSLLEFHKKLEVFSDGKYYNEAEPDLRPEQWKRAFWGMKNYWKLMNIKRVWDPNNRFTCTQCLGDGWLPDKAVRIPL